LSTFLYRPANSGDWPFIASSFAHEYQSSTLLGNEDFKRIVMPVFERQFHAALTSVAYPAAEDTEIAGWVAYRPGALVFAVVNRPYRGLGVWRGLRDIAWQGKHPAQVWPCMFRPDRFLDPVVRAAPWISLT
jgi:hypothetical protein